MISRRISQIAGAGSGADLQLVELVCSPGAPEDPAGGDNKVRSAANIDAGSVGVDQGQRLSHLRWLEIRTAIALCHCLLLHSLRNVAPHRVRRLAHSLKRDISPADTYHQAGSPMSMTSPRTTLMYGQYAPLSDRSSVAPHSSLPQCGHHVFLRADLRAEVRLLRLCGESPDSAIAVSRLWGRTALAWLEAAHRLICVREEHAVSRRLFAPNAMRPAIKPV
jgi:hypothetical protein